MLGFRCVKPLHGGPAGKLILDSLANGADLAEAAAFYWDQNKLDLVQECVDRLLKRNPRSVPGNYWQAVLLDHAGHSADAVAPLQRVLAQKARYTPSTSRLAPRPAAILGKLAIGDRSAAAALELPKLFEQARLKCWRCAGVTSTGNAPGSQSAAARRNTMKARTAASCRSSRSCCRILPPPSIGPRRDKSMS
jgi:hypothetical protein